MSAIADQGGQDRRSGELRSIRCAILRLRDGAIAEIGEHLEAYRRRRDSRRRAARSSRPGSSICTSTCASRGFPEKETIATGTQAAVRGGFTAVACMPNTQPALDDPGRHWPVDGEPSIHARCRVYPIGGDYARARRSRTVRLLGACAEAGAVAFSDDGDTVEDARRASRSGAARARSSCAVHRALPSRKRRIVARDLLIAERDCESLARRALSDRRCARASKRRHAQRGTRVTCEVTPHHLTFTSALVRRAWPGGDRQSATAHRGRRAGTPAAACATARSMRLRAITRRIRAAEKSGNCAACRPGLLGLGGCGRRLRRGAARFTADALSSSCSRRIRRASSAFAAEAWRSAQPADVTIFADRHGPSTPPRLHRRASARLLPDAGFRARCWRRSSAGSCDIGR